MHCRTPELESQTRTAALDHPAILQTMTLLRLRCPRCGAPFVVHDSLTGTARHYLMCTRFQCCAYALPYNERVHELLRSLVAKQALEGSQP